MRDLRVVVRLALHIIVPLSQHLSIKRVPVSRMRIQLSLFILQHPLEILVVKREVLLVLPQQSLRVVDCTLDDCLIEQRRLVIFS